MKNLILALLIVALTSLTSYAYYDTIESFVIKEINLEMIKCPAGSFVMGSPITEYEDTKYNKDRIGHKFYNKFSYSEKTHKVTITKPFYIGKYEVTQSQYFAVMGNNPSQNKGVNKPVDNVSNEDAKIFCEKMNNKYSNLLPKGYKFDLPTEAQWEYACRAGTNTALNNGKNLTTEDGDCPNLDEVAWYEKNSVARINKVNVMERGACHGSIKEIPIYESHEVGLKKPNAWGIYDMHGNVWEWCRDWYGEYPMVDEIDPVRTEPVPEINSRVQRGGGYNGPAQYCRSANRSYNDPSLRIYNIGIRLAIVPVED